MAESLEKVRGASGMQWGTLEGNNAIFMNGAHGPLAQSTRFWEGGASRKRKICTTYLSTCLSPTYTCVLYKCLLVEAWS